MNFVSLVRSIGSATTQPARVRLHARLLGMRSISNHLAKQISGGIVFFMSPIVTKSAILSDVGSLSET